MGSAQSKKLVEKLHPTDEKRLPPPPPNVAFLSIRRDGAGVDPTRNPPLTLGPVGPNPPGPAASPASPAAQAADIGVHYFPRTSYLLSRVLDAILADPHDGMVISFYKTVLMRVCNELLRKPGAPSEQICGIMGSATHGILSYLQQPEGLPVCISSAIERVDDVRMIWGVTNLREDRKDTLGLLIPALNWALCTAYEESVSCMLAVVIRHWLMLRILFSL